MVDSLSIVIPAYNEAERLPQSLESIRAWMDSAGVDVEVIVVDDGSRDGTAEVVRRVAAVDPRVRLHALPRNCGKGAAVRVGALAATKTWVLICDADLSTPIDDVRRLIVAAGSSGAALAIGSRDVPDSDIEEHQPWYREAMGRTFNRVVQVLAVPGIHDTQCGFKLVRRDAAQAIFSRAVVDGFAFDVEMLVLARRLGFAVTEVGVRWRNDARSKVDPLRDATRMFVDVVKIRLRHAHTR